MQANKEKETMLCVKDLGIRWQEGLGPGIWGRFLNYVTSIPIPYFLDVGSG